MKLNANHEQVVLQNFVGNIFVLGKKEMWVCVLLFGSASDCQLTGNAIQVGNVSEKRIMK